MLTIGRNLTQHTQGIETMLFLGADGPGLLNGPAQLVLERFEESFDSGWPPTLPQFAEER